MCSLRDPSRMVDTSISALIAHWEERLKDRKDTFRFTAFLNSSGELKEAIYPYLTSEDEEA